MTRPLGQASENSSGQVSAEKYHADKKLKHEETKEIRELKRIRAKADEEVMKAVAREKETKRKRGYRAGVKLAQAGASWRKVPV
jgi:pyruvate-formate lyase-activating enzyme